MKWVCACGSLGGSAHTHARRHVDARVLTDRWKDRVIDRSIDRYWIFCHLFLLRFRLSSSSSPPFLLSLLFFSFYIFFCKIFLVFLCFLFFFSLLSFYLLGLSDSYLNLLLSAHFFTFSPTPHLILQNKKVGMTKLGQELCKIHSVGQWIVNNQRDSPFKTHIHPLTH